MAADKKNKSKTKVTEDKQPGFALEKLYLKDVSIEVPSAPEIFVERDQPKISIELNNEAKPLADGYYEIALQITVTSKIGEQTAFVVDIVEKDVIIRFSIF